MMVGQRLGPYETLEAIGAGGMGEVWKARDTRLDRTVAIKIAPEKIVLDLDATDNVLYGHQEGRFYHGYYRDFCYLPLYVSPTSACAVKRRWSTAGDNPARELVRSTR